MRKIKLLAFMILTSVIFISCKKSDDVTADKEDQVYPTQSVVTIAPTQLPDNSTTDPDVPDSSQTDSEDTDSTASDSNNDTNTPDGSAGGNITEVIDEELILKNINYVPGFTMIKEQSFLADLENWGEVYFISGYGEVDGIFNLYLYLADSNSNILYEFPYFYGNGMMFDSMKAVSFQDANDDGMKDVIVIADYMTGVGEDGAKPFPLADVYFQKGKEFVSLPDIAYEINSSGQNVSVDKVLEYVKELKISLD